MQPGICPERTALINTFTKAVSDYNRVRGSDFHNTFYRSPHQFRGAKVLRLRPLRQRPDKANSSACVLFSGSTRAPRPAAVPLWNPLVTSWTTLSVKKGRQSFPLGGRARHDSGREYSVCASVALGVLYEHSPEVNKQRE